MHGKWPYVSAVGVFRFLFDISAEGLHRHQREKKAAKSTVADRLAVRFFRRCGRTSASVRTNPCVLVHKKSVSSATPSAFFRKEIRVFAEKQLILFDKCKYMCGEFFCFERNEGSDCQRER